MGCQIKSSTCRIHIAVIPCKNARESPEVKRKLNSTPDTVHLATITHFDGYAVSQELRILEAVRNLNRP